MPCLKIVPESYVNSDALDCLVHKYIYPKSHTIGGLSVDPAHAAEQMKLVKKLWLKEDGCQLLHFILAFNPWESERIKSAGELMPLAYEVCGYFAIDFQVIFGIHFGKTGLWHIHFVVNSVSFATGERLLRKNSIYLSYKYHIQSCLPDGRSIPIYYN
ncbi:relaxase/mobilization nuclease domain-containing protein [Neopoerus faecalis]|uniref:relaxase/mobilization nuclease domain-containing protein n=1 Tax=Neopoerus faecalis TaxID=3032125 RepID=UPI00257090BE|nr:relaxase/mobilization nuclease domain-containing protein [Neopoerus faecalis]